jgi:pimeloyl-ACP methyl ester carboxylesterase
MAVFVVAHGAWSAGWMWKKMHPLMSSRGHRLVTPTYTGQGERTHLARPEIDLDTHITDIINVLEFEDLTDVNLVGHSYGGMVATGVADRARGRIKQLIYLDAFAPQDDEALLDLVSPEMRTQRQTGPDGWRIPPTPLPSDTPPEDVAWATPRRVPQPARTFEQKLKLQNGPLALPRQYIYCLRRSPDDRFRPFYERAKREGWTTHEIDSSHSPQVTAPEALATLLDRIAI